jgi:hypothetical protein
VTDHYSSASTSKANGSSFGGGYSKPWGATFASTVNQLLGGESGDSGLLGDQSSLDALESDCDMHLGKLVYFRSYRFFFFCCRYSLTWPIFFGGSSLKLKNKVCQPGNGGPVEDWINVKAFHEAANGVPTCIVNGALDKVRDGYYAPFIFPKLAKTFDFYRNFEAMFFLKPISDKGVYGWLFRVYPEPWQVVLQNPVRNKQDQLVIENTVALVSDTRPGYSECVQALLKAAVSNR